MPDFLAAPIEEVLSPPLAVLLRLVVAMLLGGIVAFVYRRTRAATDVVQSFTVTLVLLAILIAMVTQVIGDNIARAFSLVGALSIVRFRTIVRDTQDTAYVIFAVAVGMAVGANHPWVAVSGLGVVSLAAFLMRRNAPSPLMQSEDLPFVLQVRVGLGHDVNTLVGPALDTFLDKRQLESVATARQGMAIDVSYRAALRVEESAGELVTALNRIEGVQSVTLQRVGSEAL
jgi:uncharacterized membrane protein YhiD involved in acid resistance